jgi:hypothetical protein
VFARRLRPFITVAVCVAVFCGSSSTRAQDVAEAARKAKAKKQQQQPDASPSLTATKPKSYTNDDFAASGGAAGTGAPGEDIVGTTEKPAPGKNTAVVILNLPNATVKRPGGTQVFWSVKNTSDHWLDLTINLIVNGPCGYHSEHPVRFRLNNGGGFGDKKTMGVAMYQDNCPGEYTFELRAESFHNLLSTASTTLKVL